MKKNSSSNPGSTHMTSTSATSTEDLASEAKDAVQKVAERVKDTATEAVGEARKQAESVVRQQQGFVADKLDCVCEALHDSAERLRDEDAAPFASLIDQATTQIEHLSSFLRDKELTDMYEGAQNWARRNPVLFLGGCFVGGLLIARLLKGATSGIHDEESFSSDQGSSLGSESQSGGPSRFATRTGLGQQSSMGARSGSAAGSPGIGQQYGSGAFTPTSPSVGQTGSRGPAGSWEET